MVIKDDLWKLMIIGDIIAMFIIIIVIFYSCYYLLVKYKPSFCYFNEKFDLSQTIRFVTFKWKKMVTMENRKPKLRKKRTVSFGDVDKNSVEAGTSNNDEAIYEEPTVRAPPVTAQ